MEPGTITMKIAPYSPEWFKAHAENFTASDAWKIMSNPKGKSPLQRFEDHAVKLAEMEAKYNNLPQAKLTLKSNVKLSEKIEAYKKEYMILHEKRNDIHLSETAETYILEKVHGKLTGMVKAGIDNASTQWGIENEPLAKKWYSKITGHVLLEPFLEFHPTIEGLSCTPDSPIDPEGLAEFKCPANGANHLKHWLISSDEYMKEKHDDHYWQCMAQMNIMGQPWNDFVSFDPRIDNDRGMFIYRLHYNEQDGQEMEKRMIAARGLFNDYYNLFSKGSEA